MESKPSTVSSGSKEDASSIREIITNSDKDNRMGLVTKVDSDNGGGRDTMGTNPVAEPTVEADSNEEADGDVARPPTEVTTGTTLPEPALSNTSGDIGISTQAIDNDPVKEKLVSYPDMNSESDVIKENKTSKHRRNMSVISRVLESKNTIFRQTKEET